MKFGEYETLMRKQLDFEISAGRVPIPDFAYMTLEPMFGDCDQTTEYNDLVQEHDRAFGQWVSGFTYNSFIAGKVAESQSKCCKDESVACKACKN